jgi:hypothetical protein
VQWGGKLILATVILTVVEGAFRKWAFANYPVLRYAVYFSKDFVFILAGLAGVPQAPARYRRYFAWILLGGTLSILPATLSFLPNETLVGTFLSLRAYILLPACAFLAAGTISSWRDIDRIVVVTGALAIGAAILGLVQFELPETHILNRYDMESALIAAEYGHVRATGPFAYISGMAVMAAAAGWAAVYLFFSAKGIFQRGFAAGVALAGIICSLVAMTRHGLIVCLFNMVGGALAFQRGGKGLQLLLVVGAILWILRNSNDPDATDVSMYGATVLRFTERDSVGSRFAYAIDNFTQGMNNYPLGHGLGAGQPGGVVASEGTLANFSVIENEQGRILFEVGIPGILGVYLIRFAAAWEIGTSLFRTKEPRLLALCAASFPMILSAFMVNMAFNHTSSSLTWCVVAVVLGGLQLRRTVDGPAPAQPAVKVKRLGGAARA